MGVCACSVCVVCTVCGVGVACMYSVYMCYACGIWVQCALLGGVCVLHVQSVWVWSVMDDLLLPPGTTPHIAPLRLDFRILQKPSVPQQPSKQEHM